GVKFDINGVTLMTQERIDTFGKTLEVLKKHIKNGLNSPGASLEDRAQLQNLTDRRIQETLALCLAIYYKLGGRFDNDAKEENIVFYGALDEGPGSRGRPVLVDVDRVQAMSLQELFNNKPIKRYLTEIRGTEYLLSELKQRIGEKEALDLYNRIAPLVNPIVEANKAANRSSSPADKAQSQPLALPIATATAPVMAGSLVNTNLIQQAIVPGSSPAIALQANQLVVFNQHAQILMNGVGSGSVTAHGPPAGSTKPLQNSAVVVSVSKRSVSLTRRLADAQSATFGNEEREQGAEGASRRSDIGKVTGTAGIGINFVGNADETAKTSGSLRVTSKIASSPIDFGEVVYNAVRELTRLQANISRAEVEKIGIRNGSPTHEFQDFIAGRDRILKRIESGITQKTADFISKVRNNSFSRDSLLAKLTKWSDDVPKDDKVLSGLSEKPAMLLEGLGLLEMLLVDVKLSDLALEARGLDSKYGPMLEARDVDGVIVPALSVAYKAVTDFVEKETSTKQQDEQIKRIEEASSRKEEAVRILGEKFIKGINEVKEEVGAVKEEVIRISNNQLLLLDTDLKELILNKIKEVIRDFEGKASLKEIAIKVEDWFRTGNGREDTRRNKVTILAKTILQEKGLEAEAGKVNEYVVTLINKLVESEQAKEELAREKKRAEEIDALKRTAEEAKETAATAEKTAATAEKTAATAEKTAATAQETAVKAEKIVTADTRLLERDKVVGQKNCFIGLAPEVIQGALEQMKEKLGKLWTPSAAIDIFNKLVEKAGLPEWKIKLSIVTLGRFKELYDKNISIQVFEEINVNTLHYVYVRGYVQRNGNLFILAAQTNGGEAFREINIERLLKASDGRIIIATHAKDAEKSAFKADEEFSLEDLKTIENNRIIDGTGAGQGAGNGPGAGAGQGGTAPGGSGASGVGSGSTGDDDKEENGAAYGTDFINWLNMINADETSGLSPPVSSPITQASLLKLMTIIVTFAATFLSAVNSYAYEFIQKGSDTYLRFGLWVEDHTNTLWNVAVDLLNKAGNSHPTAAQVWDKIYQIAKLNNIADPNKVYPYSMNKAEYLAQKSSIMPPAPAAPVKPGVISQAISTPDLFTAHPWVILAAAAAAAVILGIIAVKLYRHYGNNMKEWIKNRLQHMAKEHNSRVDARKERKEAKARRQQEARQEEAGTAVAGESQESVVSAAEEKVFDIRAEDLQEDRLGPELDIANIAKDSTVIQEMSVIEKELFEERAPSAGNEDVAEAAKNSEEESTSYLEDSNETVKEAAIAGESKIELVENKLSIDNLLDLGDGHFAKREFRLALNAYEQAEAAISNRIIELNRETDGSNVSEIDRAAGLALNSQLAKVQFNLSGCHAELQKETLAFGNHLNGHKGSSPVSEVPVSANIPAEKTVTVSSSFINKLVTTSFLSVVRNILEKGRSYFRLQDAIATQPKETGVGVINFTLAPPLNRIAAS
ncbi:MAG: hypothetical protein WC440_05755, partial [Candidatus Omnitrophota bacterium]